MNQHKMKLAAADTVLLIVDVQERLARVMEKRDQVVSNLQVLIRLARVLGFPVVVTQQYTKGLGPTVEPLASELAAIKPFEKLHFSCCGEPGFNRALGSLKKSTVVLVGMETHVCVLQTALDLLEQDYTVHVPWDAVCSRAEGNYKQGLRFMERAGAIVSSTETVAFQLLARAGTPEFKEIAALLK